MDYLSIALIVFLILVITSTMYFVLQSFFRYQDQHYMRLLLMIFYFDIWNLTRIVMILHYDEINISNEFLLASIRVGNLFLLASLLVIGYLLNNTFFEEGARTLATFGYSLFSGAGMLLVVDFVENKYIEYQFNAGKLVTQFHPFLSVLIVLGGLCLTFSYLLALRSLRKLPNVLFSSNYRYQVVMVGTSMLVLMVWIIFDNDILSDGKSFNLIFTTFMNLFMLLLIYYFFTHPFFQFNMGLSSQLLVDREYVGFFVGAITDMGPTVIAASTNFNKRIGIDEISLETLNVGATTALGINDTFSEKIGILPFPNYEEFSVIIFSFASRFEGIEDNRIRERTLSLFGIIVPSVILVNMNNLSKAQEQISNLIGRYDTLNDLINEDEIKDTTVAILNYLTV